MLRDHVPAEQGKHLSEGSTDTTGRTPAGGTHQAPPTPPCPYEGEGTFQTIIEDLEDDEGYSKGREKGTSRL